MSTIKITELDAMLSGSVVPANDVVAIVDVAGNATKKITLDELGGAMTVASASHEIITEVSSSHAETADTAGGLQGSPSILVTNITASGNISSSGIITADTGSFSYLKGNSDIDVAAGDRMIFQSGSLIVTGSNNGDGLVVYHDTGVEAAYDEPQFLVRAKLEDGEGSVSYTTNFLVKNRELNRTLIQCGQGGQPTDLYIPGVGSRIIMPITPSPTSETISGSLVPVGDNNWDIGSSNRGWKNAYFNTASIDFVSSNTSFTNGLTATNITASGVISASGGVSYFKSLDVANGNITNVGGIECDQLLFAEDTTNIFNLTATNFSFDLGEVRYVTINSQGLNVVGAITASAGISGTIETAAQAQITTLAGVTSIGQTLQTTNFPGIMTVDQGITVAANGVTVNGGGIHYDGIVTAAATDADFYSVNGQRVEVRSQLQGGVAADTGWTLQLRNTSIAANSLIVTNVIGGDGAIITGSVVTTNVVSANTASLNFFNTGLAIADNAKFTASIAIF